MSLVHGLKYEGWRRAADVMVKPMLPLVDAEGDTCVVPVPTTARRQRLRGYNQAEVLARKLSAEMELEVVLGLERKPSRRSQTRLGRAGRRGNVAAAFHAVGSARSELRNRHVLLVDDVLTTGATAAAIGRILASVGVRRLSVLTFARTTPLTAR